LVLPEMIRFPRILTGRQAYQSPVAGGVFDVRLFFWCEVGWEGGGSTTPKWYAIHVKICNCPMVFNGSMFYVFLGLKWLDIFGCMTSTEQLIASRDPSHYQ